MACHSERWLECRQAAHPGRACLRRLAPGSACRQEGNFFWLALYIYIYIYICIYILANQTCYKCTRSKTNDLMYRSCMADIETYVYFNSFWLSEAAITSVADWWFTWLALRVLALNVQGPSYKCTSKIRHRCCLTTLTFYCVHLSVNVINLLVFYH